MRESNFNIRIMTKDDLKIALSWAEVEGWNPGINDVDNFYVADEKGFLIGELDGIPISCISVVRYNEKFNFIGIYIVKPEYRHQGYGIKTWHSAFELIPNQDASLDAVLQQVENYQKFGFKPSHSHLRYRGTITEGKISDTVIDLDQVNFEELCNYDSQYFPAYRPKFLKTWINQPNGKSYGIIENGKIKGYGVIRKAVEGFKIAPLFAENSKY
jgi:hypothetical protein